MRPFDTVGAATRSHLVRVPIAALLVTLAGCSPATSTGSEPSASVEHSEAAVASAFPSEAVGTFPIEVFARLGGESVSDDLGAELQEMLDEDANGDGLTAAVISSEGTWSGATGIAADLVEGRPRPGTERFALDRPALRGGQAEPTAPIVR